MDLGQVAQNFITYFGGAPGGFIVGAALIVIGLLGVAHVVPARFFWLSTSLGIAAWTSAFIVRQLIGWA